MKKSILLLSFFASALAAEAIPVNLTLNLSTPPNQLTISELDGVYSITTSGTDGYVMANTVDVVAADNYILSFDYTSTTGLDEFGIFFNLLPSGAIATKNITLASLAPQTNWTNVKVNLKNADGLWNSSAIQNYFRLDFGKSSGKEIKVKNIKLSDETGFNFPTSFDITLNTSSTNLCTFTNPETNDWIFTTTGTDAFIHSNPFTTEMYNPAVVKYLSYEYKSTTGISDMEVYFYNPTSTKPQAANANYFIKSGPIPAAADWTVYTIDMSAHSKWKDAANLRIDFGNAAGKDFEIRKIILANYIPTLSTRIGSSPNNSNLIVRTSFETKQISISSNDKNIDNVCLTSTTGAKIFEAQYQSDKATINVYRFPKGIYILRVLSGRLLESHKIMIGK